MFEKRSDPKIGGKRENSSGPYYLGQRNYESENLCHHLKAYLFPILLVDALLFCLH